LKKKSRMVQLGANLITLHNQSRIPDESGMTKDLMVVAPRIILMYFQAKRDKQM
jgi:hypothetical protein